MALPLPFALGLLHEFDIATKRCHLPLETFNNVVENCEGTMASLTISYLEVVVFIEIPQAFAMDTLNIS